MTPLLIGSEIYRHSSYGPKHPLAIPRVSTALDLIEALGWLPPGGWIEAPMASPAELARFHEPAYIAALQRAEATQRASPEDQARFHIGAHGNPVYREVFSRPATSAGGCMLAARLTAGGGTIYCPGGGTHHGQPDRASGFCYLNDPVLGLLTWLDAGLENILYVDIDAHHGDGVQDAFRDDPRVFTLSVHEEGRWPHTGAAEDRAGGAARNLPVPAGFNDSEMLWLLHQAILPLARHLRPQAIMLQCGADALEEDPLSRLALSNNAHWGVVRALMGLTPRFLVLGGGGYNPWTVGRCWAGVWATLNGFAIPEHLPPPAEQVLRGLRFGRAAGRNPPEHWFTTLRDAPRPGVVRAAVQRVAAATLRDLPPPYTSGPSAR
ncbi:acetoin utilization protein AcuC [Belnapia sp. T6]|uniref:Acetoin utilization protein AcuC n=1 Tax=Belnapia mucosa TaxID=2804532 RepID=A0ABS1V8I2_9PROT|nr:acetoin utilization protein AcuC [Belnapia mucosa]MBL6457978.1 acetoin utilization protein AcuC [Belnapia mucosa]